MRICCDKVELPKVIDEYEWEETDAINKYAIFMGYLSMAIKGLRFLVLTWTSVVLLGGYVAMLHENDFWCLTFITLVQTAGAFDVLLNEKLSYLGQSVWGLAAVAMSAGVTGENPRFAFFLGVVLGVVQLAVLVILLCPLAAIYMFGLFISTGISLWRLTHRDYRSNAVGERANLKPALDVLYSLVLLQGVIFCYKVIYCFAEKKLAGIVAGRYGIKFPDSIPFYDYMRETRIGCEKNPSLAKGRNLFTYAVDLLESKSPNNYLPAVIILDAVITPRSVTKSQPQSTGGHAKKKFREQRMLVKHLIISSSHILQKLLRMLDSEGPHDRQTRGGAASIVAFLAREIQLKHFPQEIRCVASLLDSFEEYGLLEPCSKAWLLDKYEQDLHEEAHRSSYCLVERDEQVCYQKGGMDKSVATRTTTYAAHDGFNRKSYKKLLLQGLRILGKLAANENNCRVMSSTQGLLSKIMAPVTSDLLHQIADHGKWPSDIVEASLKAMRQLASAPGDTGANLCRELISSSMGTMERILECDKCNAGLKKQAMGVLTQVYMHPNMDTESRANFIKMLLFIFTGKDSSIREMAGQSLLKLSFHGAIKANEDVGGLTRILLDVNQDNTYRITAAEILENLCIHYTKDDEFLMEAMADVIPKVLSEICLEEATDTVGVPDFPSSNVDIEGQSGSASKDKGSSSRQEYLRQHKSYQQAALLSLCATVCDTFTTADHDLAPHFHTFTALPRKLKEIVERNSQPTTDCLRMLKLIAKMVIWMMKHRGSYLEPDLQSLMRSLSSASKDKQMVFLDGSMVFATNAAALKPVRSLASLVKEAKTIVGIPDEQEFQVMETSSSQGESTGDEPCCCF